MDGRRWTMMVAASALLSIVYRPSSIVQTTLPKQTYTYKTAADCKIQADVYRLPGDDVRPALIWIHGGALIGGNRGQVNSVQIQKLLDAGLVVISVDYRLAPETKLPSIIDDIRDAYRWARTKGPKLLKIDPNRMAVAGGSAGGYLALMAGFCLNPRPKALVSFYGYGDIAGDWYSKPDPFYSRQPAVPKEEALASVGGPVISESDSGTRFRFYLYCRQQGIWPKEVAGHDPVKESRFFDRFCPVRNVTKDYPPTLLLHGDKDTDVPYEQSALMARELERNHVEHDLITMPGRGHGFDHNMKDPEVSAAFDLVIQFLRRRLP